MTILQQLANHATERVEVYKQKLPLKELVNQAVKIEKGNYPFEQALKKQGISFICECKKASPSKGLIAPEFPYVQIAKEYEQAGADCVSVLTEPKWFQGNDNYLQEIASSINLPCLRKDFTVDEYMIYQAKALGASAILLICSILDYAQLKDFSDIANGLGLSALVETHIEDEVETALKVGARILGVNNRNLKDFSVDMENSRKLRKLVPDNVLFVAESGINTAEDIKRMADIGADAVLVGETLMRVADKKQKLTELKSLL